jgi:four helix bundle protein
MTSNTAQSQTQIVHGDDHDHVRFNFEKLDCYQVALQLNTLVPRLIPRGHRELRDQLTRASLSILLNCAESTGRTSPADKARFFSIARGSAMECAAIIDVLLSSGIAGIGLCREARAADSHCADAHQARNSQTRRLRVTITAVPWS